MVVNVDVAQRCGKNKSRISADGVVGHGLRVSCLVSDRGRIKFPGWKTGGLCIEGPQQTIWRTCYGVYAIPSEKTAKNKQPNSLSKLKKNEESLDKPPARPSRGCGFSQSKHSSAQPTILSQQLLKSPTKFPPICPS